MNKAETSGRASSSRVWLGILGAVLLGLGGCSDGSDAPIVIPKPQPANPMVSGPISGGGSDECCRFDFFGLIIDLRDSGYTPGTPFYAGLNYDEAELGYREAEFFFSGNAQSYINTDTLDSDGYWNAAPADSAEYVSRMVVLRPENPSDFNGTVLVEWFNVTGGLDSAPTWTNVHTEMMREGYAWVGVSAQIVGIEGGGAFDLPLKSVDGERYADLSHPGDSFSFDIFSQAAQAVRRPAGIDPLDGLKVERMIATGQSQSASRLVTYYNAIHPTIDLFDAYLLLARGDGSSPLSQQPQLSVPTPGEVYIRTDQPEPVLTLQSETDLLVLQYLNARQEDSARFRLWEVAGSAHSDVYTASRGAGDRGDDPAIAEVIANSDARPPFIVCDLPVNDGPYHWVSKAALSALDKWVRSGEAPASAPRLNLTADNTGFEVDNLGNALGGIRTPYVDAPVALLSGTGNSGGFGLCGLFGTTSLFDEATLEGLYPTAQDYIDAIHSATDSAVAAGYLLPADGDLINARAVSNPVVGD